MKRQSAKPAKARKKGDSSAALSAQLCRAILNASTGKVQELLEKGADANVRDGDGTPVLHRCISNVRLGLASSMDAKLLIEYGAEPNARDEENGETALHVAVRMAERLPESTFPLVEGSIVQALLDAGADANAVSALGTTPLHMWAADGWTNEHMLPELLAGDARLEERDCDGRTPLLCTKPDSSGEAKAAGQRAMLLLAAGADPRAQSNSGQTLALICQQVEERGWAGFSEAKAFLQQQGIDAGAGLEGEFRQLLKALSRGQARRNVEGGLSRAVASGDLEWVQRYLDDGAEPEGPWRDGFYPVEVAKKRGDTAMLKLLLDAGAKDRPAALDPERQRLATRDQNARKRRHERQKRARAEGAAERAANIARCLEIAATDPTRMAAVTIGSERAFAYACGHELGELVDLFLAAGVDANGVAVRALAKPLAFAVQAMDEAMVERLLSAGADPNFADAPGQRGTLKWAAAQGELSMVRLLMDAGADPLVSVHGSYPINAARGPQRNAIRRLLRDACLAKLEKSKRRPVRYKKRKHMYDAGVLTGIAEYDAYYPAGSIAFIEADLDALRDLMLKSGQAKRWVSCSEKGPVPGVAQGAFVFATTAAPTWCVVGLAAAPYYRVNEMVAAASAMGWRCVTRERTSFHDYRRTFGGEWETMPAATDDWLDEEGVWVPPFYVEGEGMYDVGDVHLLSFKGVTAEAIARIDHVTWVE